MKRLLWLLAVPLLLATACTDQDPVAPEEDVLTAVVADRGGMKGARGMDAPYAVGFNFFMIHDETREGRPIPVYVWYPVDPAEINGSFPEAMIPLFPFDESGPYAPSSEFEDAGFRAVLQDPPPARGPFPLIMYSPGWQGTAYNSGYTFATELAARGFVVAAVTHWGDQSTMNPAEPFDHLGMASYNRPRDVSKALDSMLGWNADDTGPMFGLMDTGRIGAAGWSLGGYAAMVLAAGDDLVCDRADVFPDWPVPPETCAPSFPDPRISFLIPMDGSNQLLHFHELARVQVPVLGMGQEWSQVGPWQARQHAAFGGKPAYRVDFLGTRHFSFANLCSVFPIMGAYGAFPPGMAEWWVSQNCPPGELALDEVRRLVVKYAYAFLIHDKSVLTPGHAISREGDIEFFVTERPGVTAVLTGAHEDFNYFMHQPGKTHGESTVGLTASAPKDPAGFGPMDFATWMGRTR
jgi:hypothetical protein